MRLFKWRIWKLSPFFGSSICKWLYDPLQCSLNGSVQDDCLDLPLQNVFAVFLCHLRGDDYRWLEISLNYSALRTNCCRNIWYITAVGYYWALDILRLRCYLHYLKSPNWPLLSKESSAVSLTAWATTAFIVALMLELCTRSRCTRLWCRIK